MEMAAARKPFYQRGSFWLGPFTWGLGLVLAVGLAIGWYVLGGFPRDHDKYGEVSVPGQEVLALPSGDVRLNFENHATHTGDSTTLDDRPAGLDVKVTPASGGQLLAVDDVPSWLFSSTSGSRGHEPYGKIDVPSAGDYLVSVSDDGGPLQPPRRSRPSRHSLPPSTRARRSRSASHPGRRAIRSCWGRSSAASR